MPSNLITPRTRKLRAAITAPEVATVIKINFNITGYSVLFAGGVAYGFKVHGCPGLA
jgi:hypothetical protein